MKVIVKKIRGKGRGVVAISNFNKGEIVEQSPILFISKDETELYTNKTVIKNYCFDCGNGNTGIALGLMSLLNHSETPNVKWSANNKKQVITFKTIRKIRPNEELTIDYNYPYYEWMLSKKEK